MANPDQSSACATWPGFAVFLAYIIIISHVPVGGLGPNRTVSRCVLGSTDGMQTYHRPSKPGLSEHIFIHNYCYNELNTCIHRD